MKKVRIISTVVFLIIAIASLSYAEVPKLINYQGHLTDKGGNPITGNSNITFRIYDAESGGSILWSETQIGVSAKNGIFNVLLGSATVGGIPESVFSATNRWLGIIVGNDSEMSPRQQLVSVPYAYRAGQADESLIHQKTYYNDTPKTINGGWQDYDSFTVNARSGALLIGMTLKARLLPAVFRQMMYARLKISGTNLGVYYFHRTYTQFLDLESGFQGMDDVVISQTDESLLHTNSDIGRQMGASGGVFLKLLDDETTITIQYMGNGQIRNIDVEVYYVMNFQAD